MAIHVNMEFEAYREAVTALVPERFLVEARTIMAARAAEISPDVYAFLGNPNSFRDLDSLRRGAVGFVAIALGTALLGMAATNQDLKSGLTATDDPWSGHQPAVAVAHSPTPQPAVSAAATPTPARQLQPAESKTTTGDAVAVTPAELGSKRGRAAHVGQTVMARGVNISDGVASNTYSLQVPGGYVEAKWDPHSGVRAPHTTGAQHCADLTFKDTRDIYTPPDDGSLTITGGHCSVK